MYQFIKGFVIHKWLVLWYIMGFCRQLLWRGLTHDMSKISKEERGSFIALASNDALKKFTYNSEEYKAEIAKHKAIIDVHYRNNSHHPDHHIHGLLDMDLFDIIEMVCDWRAAGRRTKDGNLRDSFETNKGRYEIPDELFDIVWRTFSSHPIPPELHSQVKKTWIIRHSAGYCPIVKIPKPSYEGTYEMLKELEQIDPAASLLVCKLAYGDNLWVSSGHEEISIYEGMEKAEQEDADAG